MRVLELSTWKRRQHFELYRDAPDPFWNVTVDVDVTRLVERCRQPGGPSFFLSTLWLALAAVNRIEELRMRIRGDRVVVLDRIHVGATILRPDETFVFGYFDFVDDYAEFETAGRRTIRELREGDGLLRPRPDRDDLVHTSVLPWLSFTSFAHARGPDRGSIPALVFGRHRPVEGRQRMPISIQVHHALVDGLHVGRFVERFQALLDSPPERFEA